MTPEQIQLLTLLGFAALGVVCFGPFLYLLGKRRGYERGVQAAFARVACDDAETMRRETERVKRLEAMGLKP